MVLYNRLSLCRSLCIVCHIVTHQYFMSFSFQFPVISCHIYSRHLDPQGIDDLICHGGSKTSFFAKFPPRNFTPPLLRMSHFDILRHFLGKNMLQLYLFSIYDDQYSVLISHTHLICTLLYQTRFPMKSSNVAVGRKFHLVQLMTERCNPTRGL